MIVLYLYILSAVLGDRTVDLGVYRERGACEQAAQDYKSARCREVEDSAPVFGTCWGCMHGCTREQNIKVCGLDPL
jgi:hypothetical protein